MTTFKTLFETKEKYLEFRAAWKKAMNDKELKHQLTAAHHATYALLRDRDLSKAFTPIQHPQSGLNLALKEIRHLARCTDDKGEWRQRYVARFLALFNGTVSTDMLRALALYEHD